MGGLFGLVSQTDCVKDLFFGTDYHSHLGTKRGGMAVQNKYGFKRFIHNIENTPFRSKLEPDLLKLKGNKGIGVISDFDDQPLLIRSHLGNYAIVTVGAIQNAEELAEMASDEKGVHFSEMSGGEINPTELTAALINQEGSFVEGIQKAQNLIEGSCSLLLLTNEGIYAARDKLGRTPLVIGKKERSLAITSETCAFPNLHLEIKKYLGPGEIVFLSQEGIEPKKLPEKTMKICSFLWVYYGFPASSYEGISVETVRNRCGRKLAQIDSQEIDLVAGIPDSGTAHGLGYASKTQIPFLRPFVKYTPTWPRSFMPQNQAVRDLVAKMKLIPIKDLIENKRILFCEDSIVRGTQLKDTIQRLYHYGASEVHMRPACPPLIYGCKYLNFSRSRSELDLAARKAVQEIEGEKAANLSDYAHPDSEKHHRMVDKIRQRLKLTSLRYQRLEELVKAIGLPKEKLCTYCWDGCG
ncbi:amidophosphoribosyltransferase [bacterium]|nr:amidophosphoribosyltransferase [bacterium]